VAPRLGPGSKRALRAVHRVAAPVLGPLAAPFFRARCNLCGGPVPGGGGRPRCLVCLSTPPHRAVGEVLRRLGLEGSHRVYELSHHGALFDFLTRKLGPGLTSSEFLGGGTRGKVLGGVRSEDVQDLTFPDGSFDFVTSTEVFEHVPDDGAGMREVARVLRPGGAFVFTVPLYPVEETRERARVRAGRVEHLLPPEYHGDPVRGDGGVLVFREYGRDILRRFADTGLRGSFETVDLAGAAVHGVTVCLFRRWHDPSEVG
jgi:SAM-dependent methyltransferase